MYTYIKLYKYSISSLSPSYPYCFVWNKDLLAEIVRRPADSPPGINGGVIPFPYWKYKRKVMEMSWEYVHILKYTHWLPIQYYFRSI